MWTYLWDTSATQIQCALRKWFARRRYFKFRRGCGVMKRVFRGQIRRKWLRKLIENLQALLDMNAGTECAALIGDLNKEEWPFFVDTYTIRRLCSGNTCLSSEEYFPGKVNVPLALCYNTKGVMSHFFSSRYCITG